MFGEIHYLEGEGFYMTENIEQKWIKQYLEQRICAINNNQNGICNPISDFLTHFLTNSQLQEDVIQWAKQLGIYDELVRPFCKTKKMTKTAEKRFKAELPKMVMRVLLEEYQLSTQIGKKGNPPSENSPSENPEDKNPDSISFRKLAKEFQYQAFEETAQKTERYHSSYLRTLEARKEALAEQYQTLQEATLAAADAAAKATEEAVKAKLEATASFTAFYVAKMETTLKDKQQKDSLEVAKVLNEGVAAVVEAAISGAVKAVASKMDPERALDVATEAANAAKAADLVVRTTPSAADSVISIATAVEAALIAAKREILASKIAVLKEKDPLSVKEQEAVEILRSTFTLEGLVESDEQDLKRKLNLALAVQSEKQRDEEERDEEERDVE